MSLPPGWRIARVGVTGSTNADLVAQAGRGAPEGTALLADVQLAGRGRERRVWQSPAGNLHLSVILRPGCAARDAGQIGLVAAVAVAGMLSELGVRARLKWPNDVLVDGAKVAGVLVETRLAGERVDWAVVGIGLNVLWHPDDAGYPATSLAAALGDVSAAPPPQPSPARTCEVCEGEGIPAAPQRPLPPCGGGPGRGVGAAHSASDLAPKLLSHLAARYATWQMHGFAPLREAWRALGPAAGETVRARIGALQLTGAFHDLDPGGALVLEVSPGQHRRIAAGELMTS